YKRHVAPVNQHTTQSSANRFNIVVAFHEQDRTTHRGQRLNGGIDLLLIAVAIAHEVRARLRRFRRIASSHGQRRGGYARGYRQNKAEERHTRNRQSNKTGSHVLSDRTKASA